MCGIIARVGRDAGVDELLTGLSNLEYRGYDSAGIAVVDADGGRPRVQKCEGRIDDLRPRVSDALRGAVGIGHTRWSTHGPPSDANAHPHTDCTGRVAVAHNGIIENYDQLRAELSERGHTFESDTDTEVVPHLVEEFLAEGDDTRTAFERTVSRLEGSYALTMVVAGETAVYATRRGSPLVLGVGDDRYYLASDVPAFLEFTDRVVYLEDGQMAVVTPDGFTVSNADGTVTDPSVATVDWDPDDTGKGTYDHYMLKEIHEQPQSLRQSLQGRLSEADVTLDLFDEETLRDVRRLHFVACGTSYHAARYGVELGSSRGVPAQAFRASEYVASPPPVTEGTLTVAVTQSGETADTLRALRTARADGARTLAVTNVVGSTVTRETDDALFIRAGPEIGVAATKTFSSQVATLALLVERIAADTGSTDNVDEAFVDELGALPDAVQRVLDTSGIATVARAYADADSYFFIGRSTDYAVAMEAALKFKEITYEHAEGFAAGELKHGPLALVTERTPVFGIVTGDDEKTRHNLEEVRARGAPVVAITDAPEAVRDVADHVLEIPETHPEIAGVLANVQLQLLAYHAAAQLDRPIDKPRNLAKSVTVE